MSAALPPVDADHRPVQPATPPEHDALDLTRGGPEARIRLHGMVYTLRVTRQSKLILTK